MGASLLRYGSLPFCMDMTQPHLHVHQKARVRLILPVRSHVPSESLSTSVRRVMDTKSTQTVQMTVSLPESNGPTTWTTQAASERFFDDFPSSCHHPQLVAATKSGSGSGKTSARRK